MNEDTMYRLPGCANPGDYFSIIRPAGVLLTIFVSEGQRLDDKIGKEWPLYVTITCTEKDKVFKIEAGNKDEH